MNISSKAECGIRAMVEIANGTAPVKRGSIAERQLIPVPFLSQILRDLVNGGLVTSSRGPDGGYLLASAPEKINLLEIVTKLQGRVSPKGCVDTSNSESCAAGGNNCLLRDVWSRLKEVNEEVLTSVSLADLVVKEGGSDARSIFR